MNHFGRVVYHLAFPEVRAVIVESAPAPNGYIKVTFEEPVLFSDYRQFSGSLGRPRTEWSCNLELLKDDQGVARLLHRPPTQDERKWKD